MNRTRVFQPRECSRVRSLLDDFLSSELSVETNQEILAHLDVCAECDRERCLREGVRDRLRKEWNAQPVSASLQDKAEAMLGNRRRFFPAWALWAAATVLTAMGVGALVMLPWEDEGVPTRAVQWIDHYHVVARDHIECAGYPTEDPGLPLEHYQAAVESVLQETPFLFHLVSIDRCRLEDASFVHYTFKGEGLRLSLFFEAREERQHLAELAGNIQKVLEGVRLQLVRQNSLTVTALESPRHFVYLVSEAGEGATLRLAEKLLPPLKAALFEGAPAIEG